MLFRIENFSSFNTRDRIRKLEIGVLGESASFLKKVKFLKKKAIKLS